MISVDLDVLEIFEVDEFFDGNPEMHEKIFQEELKLFDIFSEGIFAQAGFNVNDNIGIACLFLEKIRKGEEADLFCLVKEMEEVEN